MSKVARRIFNFLFFGLMGANIGQILGSIADLRAIGALTGLILGVLLGNVINAFPHLHLWVWDETTDKASGQAQQGTPRGGLAASLVVLVAAVIKADGRVMQSQLNVVKSWFVQHFGEDIAREAILQLRDLIDHPQPIYGVCAQLRTSLNLASRRELLRLLCSIATADGEVQASERNIIQRIAVHLGMSSADFSSAMAMRPPTLSNPDWAYKILELLPAASDDEVKKAYRRMAAKHHPDKVAQLGEDVQREATEKFRKIQEAYDWVKEKRGMK
jgi:DnaJ like chaperone protein